LLAAHDSWLLCHVMIVKLLMKNFINRFAVCTLFHSTSLPRSSSNFQPWKDSDNLPNHPPLLSWRRNSLEPQKEEHHFNLFTSKFLRLSKLHSLDISSIAPSFILKILSFLFFDSYSFGLAASDPKKRCGLSGERKSL
jgi:hypothetical protein